jgi:hypothetical protein
VQRGIVIVAGQYILKTKKETKLCARISFPRKEKEYHGTNGTTTVLEG